MAVLSCTELSKTYTLSTAYRVSKPHSMRPSLAGVGLSLEVGEHLAVTGPSGSGKSTLLRLLAGVLEPTRGEVRQDGAIVNRPGFRVPPHNRGVGVLFQGLALWPHLTALENVQAAVPGGATLARERRRSARRQAEELLADVGLADLRERYPAELSGGERERVAWARAVARSPRLLFLDEPLTSIDPRLRDDLFHRVEAYAAQEGRTLVLVTHDPALASRFGRQILTLAQHDP